MRLSSIPAKMESISSSSSSNPKPNAAFCWGCGFAGAREGIEGGEGAETGEVKSGEGEEEEEGEGEGDGVGEGGGGGVKTGERDGWRSNAGEDV